MNQKFIMMVGLPASGKSTMSERLAFHHDAKIFSSDEYRKTICGDENDQTQNEKVFECLYKDMIECLESGHSAIFDATNINRKSRKKCLDKIKHIECEKIAYIVPTFFNRCLERDEQRERQVGGEVIHKFAKSFEVPMLFEGFTNIVICKEFAKNTPDYSNVVCVEMRYFDQHNPYHTFFLGKHCDNVARALSLTNEAKNNTNLYIAGKYHDVGKYYTRTFDKKNIAHYYGHEHYSALWILGDFWLQEKFEDKDLVEIAFYAGEHMHIRDILKSEKAIKKYKELFGEEYFNNLCILTDCDNFGSNTDVIEYIDRSHNVEIRKVIIDSDDEFTHIAVEFCLPDFDNYYDEIQLKIGDGKIISETFGLDSKYVKLFTKNILSKLTNYVEINN